MERSDADVLAHERIEEGLVVVRDALVVPDAARLHGGRGDRGAEHDHRGRDGRETPDRESLAAHAVRRLRALLLERREHSLLELRGTIDMMRGSGERTEACV